MVRIFAVAGALLAVLASFCYGFAHSQETAGPANGLVAGVISAALWALGSVFPDPWNARLNLFAAILAAGSLGLLAPSDRVCAVHPIPPLCR